jgi:2-oxoacid:acceptor oxidoreductase delta subunit (pyruvate/2-ketoisovalerate family)
MKEEKLKYAGIKGVPVIKAIGSSEKLFTGSWRVFRPVVNMKKCKRCKICYVVCPESAIQWKNSRPVINYHTCKGCLVCVKECPFAAMNVRREK